MSILRRRGAKTLILFSFAIIALCVKACGLLDFGSGSINDPIPGGTLFATGDFSGSATGAVLVYQQSTPSTFVIRLEGLSIASASGIQVIYRVNSSEIFAGNLRATTGNQNYTATGAQIGNAPIVSLRQPPNQDIATATLSRVNP